MTDVIRRQRQFPTSVFFATGWGAVFLSCRYFVVLRYEILDKPDLTPADLLSEDDRTRLALSPAEAEVKAITALASLDRFECGEATPTEIAREFQGFMETITDDLTEERMTQRDYRKGLSLLRRLGNAIETETAPEGKRHRLLRRYLREARARQRRAFQAWLAYLGEETKEVREAA